MAFVMEKRTEELHKKIFTEENKALINKYCALNDEWHPLSKSGVAIDRERDAIFLMVAKYAPIDTIRRYLLIFRDTPMMIEMGGGFVIFPMDIPDHLKSHIEEVRNVIRDAFIVYGSYGIGIPSSDEIPTPTFQ